MVPPCVLKTEDGVKCDVKIVVDDILEVVLVLLFGCCSFIVFYLNV